MQAYVDGALFNQDFTKLVLVKKNKPEWQFGKLNFVGGKIEREENIHQAMSREFKEETGLLVPESEWTFKLSIISPNWIVYFFSAIGDVTKVKTMESEEIHVVDVKNLSNLNIVKNVNWITNLILDGDILLPVSFYELNGVKP